MQMNIQIGPRRCKFLFCLIKNPLLCREARPESGREAREVSQIAADANSFPSLLFSTI